MVKANSSIVIVCVYNKSFKQCPHYRIGVQKNPQVLTGQHYVVYSLICGVYNTVGRVLSCKPQSCGLNLTTLPVLVLQRFARESLQLVPALGPNKAFTNQTGVSPGFFTQYLCVLMQQTKLWYMILQLMKLVPFRGITFV